MKMENSLLVEAVEAPTKSIYHRCKKTSGNEKYAKWVNDLLMSKNPHDRSVGEYHKRQIDAIGKSR